MLPTRATHQQHKENHHKSLNAALLVNSGQCRPAVEFEVSLHRTQGAGQKRGAERSLADGKAPTKQQAMGDEEADDPSNKFGPDLLYRHISVLRLNRPESATIYGFNWG
eukprot:3567108-Prymnesium_polylepis.1